MKNLDIKNYTNHDLCFFSPEQVKKGRGTDHYTLVNDNTLPYFSVPRGVALSAKKAEGNTLMTFADGITLKAPSVITSQLDLPMTLGVTDNTIFVVSPVYAAEAIAKNFDFIHRVYVPSGKVYNSAKKCVGCLTLEKAVMFPYPSLCLTGNLDLHSRRLAAMYWRPLVWQLTAYEKAAFTRLEQSIMEPMHSRTFSV